MSEEGKNIIINEGLSKTLKALFKWDEIPEHIRKNFWNIFLTDTALNFLTEKDIPYLMNNFELEKIYLLATMPRKAYTEETMLLLHKIRTFNFLQIKRAVGVRGNINNERLTLAKTIHELIETKPQEKKGGLLKR